MDKVKILIIDDDSTYAESVGLSLEETFGDDSVIKRGFDIKLHEIAAYAPDAIVLDLFYGKPQDDKNEGSEKWAMIWEKYFIPIVVASATDDEEVRQKTEAHPMMDYIIKSEDPDFGKIVASISNLLAYGLTINGVRNEIHNTIQICLTQTIPFISSGLSQRALAKTTYRRMRRNIAALIDCGTIDGENILPWEQYIFPPVVPHLLACDVIRRIDGPYEPDSFRINLTPSCDLAQKKVSHILAAKCVPFEQYVKSTQLTSVDNWNFGDSKNDQEKKKKVEIALRTNQPHGYFPIPKFFDKLPHMAISLKEYELIKIDEIGEEKPYTRVCSIDSPFRESLVWAYLQICGRPGLPVTNYGAWIDEIANDFAQRETGS